MRKQVKRSFPTREALSKSEQMALVRTRDTAPEQVLRRALWAKGMRYKLHADVAGTPDFVFVRRRVAVFVDGCFWHGCPKHGTMPRTNRAFWRRKLATNRARDRRVNRKLRGSGWRVFRIWEHSVETSLDQTVKRILDAVLGS